MRTKPVPIPATWQASLLVEAGAKYVILGHSERRTDHGETNAEVRGKVAAALKVGLIPIVCVGETGPERDAGEEKNIVHMQLTHSLPDNFVGLIAYEPVWAIGTGRTPSEAEVAAMHAHIRATLVTRFPGSGANTADSLWRLGQTRQCRQPCWRCRRWAARWSAAPACSPPTSLPLLPAPRAARTPQPI